MTLVAALILVAAVIVVYGQVRGFSFLMWDDDRNVYENPFLVPLTVSGLSHVWTEPYFASYLPVTYTFWGGISLLAQSPDPASGIPLDPAVFHIANLVMHAADTLLVFWLLRLLVGAGWPAFVGAALFAVHPLQVETVAWVSGMKDLLTTFLGLLAIICYLRYSRADAATPVPTRRLWYALGLGLYVLALLSKPSAAALPLIAWGLDTVMLRRRVRDATLALLPWALLALPVPLILLAVDPVTVSVGAQTPFWLRPLIAGDAFAFYLGKLLAPHNMGFDYGRTLPVLRAMPWLYLAWIVPACLGWILWRVRGRWPWLTAGGALFLAGLAPMLGLVSIPFQEYSTVADRYVYMAMMGPALAVAGLLSTWSSRRLFAAVLLIVMLLGFQASMQTMYWRNDVAVFGHALEMNPASWVSYGNIGVALVKTGDFGPAIPYFEKALELRPDAIEPRLNLASVLRAGGLTDDAIAHLRELVQHFPERADVHDYLASALEEGGQDDEAREQWAEAIRLEPRFVMAYYNLAMSQYRAGQVDEAIANLRNAVRLAPDFEQARLSLQAALVGREPPPLRQP